MTRVSVIVPIYNMEKYLRRSIESIQKQTLKDIQIILVNDGSTDKSLTICKEYQKKDNRIKIIDKPNGGVSSARNAGLEVAEGEYIGFVDPDDWIEPDMYNNMYNLVKGTDSDTCMCDYKIENQDQSIPVVLELNKNLLERKDVLQTILPNMLGNTTLNSGPPIVMGCVWRLLIRKDLISRYHLNFENGISFMEDLIFTIQILLKSKLICVNQQLNYHYVINPTSAVTSYKKDIVNIQQQVYEILKDLLIEERVYSLVEQRMNMRYVRLILNGIVNEFHKDNYKKEKQKINVIKSLSRDQKLRDILESIDTKGYTLRKKLILFALKYKLPLFIYFYFGFKYYKKK